jgi:hypothetical protein
LFVALAGLVAFVVIDLARIDVSRKNDSSIEMETSGRGETASRSRGEAADKAVGQFAFRKRAPIGEPQGAVFDSHNWQPSPITASKVVAPPPVAPPMPYRFSGATVYEGRMQIFLAKIDTIIPVAVGETIEGGYRVDAIDERQVTLTYLPLEQKQVISISTPVSFAGADLLTAVNHAAPRVGAVPVNAIGAGPVLDEQRQNPSAQLLWHGPRQVKLGTQFTVTLRVTSAQPVRAAPMQISVDPALLQTIAVKPGRFFGEGNRNFTYRHDPGGSIFIAASSRDPVRAADAEFVVLTFKSRKPAPAAELSVASLSLHGPAGQVIAFDPLVAFKTAITP